MAVDTTVQVIAPGAGESVTEGSILEWSVEEGGRIDVDETLVEISTDKVDVEVPSPVAGTVVKRYFDEGDTVIVGAVLADVQPLADGSGNESSPAPSESSAPAPEDGTQPTTPGVTLDIVAPGAGESITEGTLLEWHVALGARVEADATLVEISTDKVDVELPSPARGTITELLAAEGDTVTVGQVIARMTTSTDAGDPAGTASPSTNGAAAPSAAPAGAPSSPTAAPSVLPDGVRVSPVAARAAAHEGIDLATVTGTGPRGRITKEDVLGRRTGAAPAKAASDRATSSDASSNGAAPAAAKPEGAELIKGSAAVLARYMDESRSIPTATSFRTLAITAMDSRRRQLKAGDQRVSFTHLIAYAIALAVQQDMPAMARHFLDVDGTPHVVDDDAVHLGIAVDVTTKKGRTLMVPVIKDAGRKSFADFKGAFDDLIAKARENKLTADDLQGANVSLTNPGGIGTIASVPRLMNGQGTIVATGAIAYPVGLGAIGDMIGAEKVMTMTSTYDHRIIQGAQSGQFLKVVEDYLQGENGFYDGVFASLGVAMGPAPQLPAPAAAAAALRDSPPDPLATNTGTMPSEELLQGVQAAVSLLKAHRTHGHLAARLDPLGSEPEGDPALDPEPLSLTPELMAQIPAKILRMHVPGATLADALPHLRETYCGTIAYEIEHISSHLAA